MTPSSPPQSIGVAGIAASLMLAPSPHMRKGTTSTATPVNFILTQLVTVSWISNTDAAR